MRIEWLWRDSLAGSGRPGLMTELDADLEQMRGFGIDLVVNLTETASEPEVEAAGFEVLHLPIRDMGTPTPQAMAEACDDVISRIDRGQTALAHCKAGIGRTGTFLACCLVHRGEEPKDAILEVRLINSRYIQTQSQERFVHHFAEHLETRRSGS